MLQVRLAALVSHVNEHGPGLPPALGDPSSPSTAWLDLVSLVDDLIYMATSNAGTTGGVSATQLACLLFSLLFGLPSAAGPTGPDRSVTGGDRSSSAIADETQASHSTGGTAGSSAGGARALVRQAWVDQLSRLTRVLPAGLVGVASLQALVARALART